MMKLVAIALALCSAVATQGQGDKKSTGQAFKRCNYAAPIAGHQRLRANAGRVMLCQMQATAPEAFTHCCPQYNLGESDPVCSLIIRTGPGTQIYAVTTEAHTAASCTDLAKFPLTDLGFVTIEVKCAGPGLGYFLNGPAEVDGATPIPGPQYACNKFRTSNNILEIVYTVGDSADVKCPGEAPDVFAFQALKKGESDLVAYNVYYPLGGALGALC
eukprot:19808-Heterococcus_DN1.PRE.1